MFNPEEIAALLAAIEDSPSLSTALTTAAVKLNALQRGDIIAPIYSIGDVQEVALAMCEPCSDEDARDVLARALSRFCPLNGISEGTFENLLEP